MLSQPRPFLVPRGPRLRWTRAEQRRRRENTRVVADALRVRPANLKLALERRAAPLSPPSSSSVTCLISASTAAAVFCRGSPEAARSSAVIASANGAGTRALLPAEHALRSSRNHGRVGLPLFHLPLALLSMAGAAGCASEFCAGLVHPGGREGSTGSPTGATVGRRHPPPRTAPPRRDPWRSVSAGDPGRCPAVAAVRSHDRSAALAHSSIRRCTQR